MAMEDGEPKVEPPKEAEKKEHEHAHFPGKGPHIPDGQRFKSCAECDGLHSADERCLSCNAPLFDDDPFCWNCGKGTKELKEHADGYCTHCNHELLADTALNPENKDYACPGCHLGSEEGAKFKFKTPEARTSFYATKAKADEASKALAAAKAAKK